MTAFGLEGVTPISEAITAQAQTLFPMVIALIMVGGFVCNLVIAKLTKFKYIFLTGGHSLFPVSYTHLMLATIDANSHLGALQDLAEFLGRKEFIETLGAARDAGSIVSYIPSLTVCK